MRVLVAEDDPITQRLLRHLLATWGYQTVGANTGTEAWEVLRQPDAPSLAILDWMMPGLSGPEICCNVRQNGRETFLLLLTGKNSRSELEAARKAGADDCVVKPFVTDDLRARLAIARRIVDLQTDLALARERLIARDSGVLKGPAVVSSAK